MRGATEPVGMLLLLLPVFIGGEMQQKCRPVFSSDHFIVSCFFCSRQHGNIQYYDHFYLFCTHDDLQPLVQDITINMCSDPFSP